MGKYEDTNERLCKSYIDIFLPFLSKTSHSIIRQSIKHWLKSVLQNYSSINDYTLLLHYINSFHVVDSIMHKNKVDGEKLLRFLNKSSNQQSTIFLFLMSLVGLEAYLLIRMSNNYCFCGENQFSSKILFHNCCFSWICLLIISFEELRKLFKWATKINIHI